MRNALFLVSLGGCVFAPVDLGRQHPNWSQQEIRAIEKCQLWTGMSSEQMACSLGLRAYNRHWHLDPSTFYQYPDGNVYIYKLTYSYWYTGHFSKDNKLQYFTVFCSY